MSWQVVYANKDTKKCGITKLFHAYFATVAVAEYYKSVIIDIKNIDYVNLVKYQPRI